LSQIHYHFGSKEQLILAMLRAENESLVRRQAQMFALDVPLSVRWDVACDYFDDDLESGYVRVLQEMMAAGWSSPDVRAAVGEVLEGWFVALGNLAADAQRAGTHFGPFEPRELVALVAAAFLGAESMVLLGLEHDRLPLRLALRRVGDVLRTIEREP
jgi:AcrR family transcriptional regulator